MVNSPLIRPYFLGGGGTGGVPLGPHENTCRLDPGPPCSTYRYVRLPECTFFVGNCVFLPSRSFFQRVKAPEKDGRATPKGKDRLPTIIFQGRAVKLPGSRSCYFWRVLLTNKLGCPPAQGSSHHQNHYIFRRWFPINLHVPLASWERGQPNQ